MTTLPPGWTWTTLGDVALSVKNGIFVSRPGADPDGVPILRISAVRPGQLDLTDIRYSGTEAGALASADQLVSTSDLLFTRYNGNIDYVGACAIVPHAVGALTYPDKLIRVRIDTAVADPAYVCYAFQTPAVRAEVRKSARTTAGQAGISGSNLRRIGFPLPPLAEQRRIVAALEESLSHYASGIKSVQQAQSRLRVLRQAIFDFVATGRVASTAADDAPPRSENADLVNGWQWRRPHELTTGERSDIAIGPFGSSLKVSDYTSSGVPLIFVRNIRTGTFSNERTRFVSTAKARELSSHVAVKGDVLVTKMGDPPGDSCVYTGDVPAIITADCIRIRPSEPCNSEYLAIAINSTIVRRQIERITRGVAQRKVSLARFRNEVMIPVPPAELQTQAVQEAERLLTLTARLEAALTAAMVRARYLRRSILVEAFLGRLVEQDPNDEPASELLARIRAERASAPARKRTRSPRTPRQAPAPSHSATASKYQEEELPL